MRYGKINLNISRYVKSISQTAIIFTSFLFLLSSISSADTINRSDAEKIVAGWIKTDNQPLGTKLGREIKKTDTFKDTNGQILYYVVYLEPNGFIIAAADDMVEPIICFVEKGQYNPSDDNPLGALVSRDLPNMIAAAKAIQSGKAFMRPSDKAALESEADKAKAKWKRLADAALRSTEESAKGLSYISSDGAVGTLGLGSVSDMRVAPLTASQWGQANIGGFNDTPACYNYYTPPYAPGDNRNYPCGCVTTASTQLMRYFRHPAVYDWNNMPLVPDLSTPEFQRQTIGQLCYDFAVDIGTTFGPGGSDAYIGNANTALKTAYDYSNSILADSPTLGTTFSNMVNTNLDACKPVLLALSESGVSGGNVVVCDG